MSKMKDLLMDIEACITNGDAFDDIIKFVVARTGCDEQTATDMVFQVEGDLCMEEERDYWVGQEHLPDEEQELY
jgi:hypothetical protein